MNSIIEYLLVIHLCSYGLLMSISVFHYKTGRKSIWGTRLSTITDLQEDLFLAAVPLYNTTIAVLVMLDYVTMFTTWVLATVFRKR